jgi:gliding motility-associated-like protein
LRQLTCFIILSLLISSYAFSQGPTSYWYFGIKAGIVFINYSPLADTNSIMSTPAGCATISNYTGNLEYYASANTGFNRLHDTLTNANNLLGNTSFAQSPIFIPNPENSSLHYLITDRLYSKVVKTPINPNGIVTEWKNIPLFSTAPAVRTTAVHHSNGRDIWLIQRINYFSDTIFAYLVSANGLNPNPIISTVANTPNFHGQLKSSPNGQFLVESVQNSPSFSGTAFFLHKFNSTTGEVSNTLSIVDSISSYGSEFSSNSNNVFISSVVAGISGIFRYDITTYNPTSIVQSKDTVTNAQGIYSLQIGIDKNIYGCHSTAATSGYLCKIQDPNNPSQLTFNDSALYLNSRSAFHGLPDFIQSYFHPAYFDFDHLCFNDSTMFYSRTNNADSVKWDFGEPSSGVNNSASELFPKHLYNSVGEFNVTHIVYAENSIDTFSRLITIKLPPLALSIEDTTLCIGDSLFLNPNPNQAYSNHLWMDTIYNPSISISDSGTFWVCIWNECDTLYDTISVFVNDTLQLQSLPDTSFCEGDTLILSAHTNENATWLWSNGDSTSQTQITANGNNEIETWVTATNACGSASDTAMITVLPQPNIAWFSDSILCNQALPVITNPNTFGVDYTLLYNFNSSVFDTVNPWTIDTAGLYFLVAENSCDTIVSRAFLSPQQIIEKELLESITLCPGEEVVLDAFWEGSSYVWSENVDGALISDSAIVVSAPLNHQSGSLSDQTGTELYTITITNPPCVRTLSTTVIFLSEDSCGNACAFSVPNVFTPNQDGVNDAFKISNSCGSQSFRFSIYNRWGTLIHSGTESIAYWDGTSNGAFVNSGVYFVIIEYTDSAGQEKTVKIAVSVLR